MRIGFSITTSATGGATITALAAGRAVYRAVGVTGEHQGAVTPRRSYATWRYAARNTWNAARVAEAIRSWADEMGEPPRSYEWSPSSARTAGLIGPGEHKWEREHPRWPGNTTVYRYYRSWYDALRAAGFPAPEPPDLSLPERIEAARRLRAAGEGTRAIADHLGVSTSTVYHYDKAHPCRECGGWVVGPGKLCRLCTLRRANPRRWTREELLDAARTWTAEVGASPTQKDWGPSVAGTESKWEREFPRWPSSGAVKVVFGGWNAFAEALGRPPYNPPWRDEEIIEALRRIARGLGRSPTKEELEANASTLGWPSAATVRRRFGSVIAGIDAAGLAPARSFWPRERLIEAAHRFEREQGHPPRGRDWEKASERSPSRATVRKEFGSWDDFLAAAGFGPAPRTRRRRSSPEAAS